MPAVKKYPPEINIELGEREILVKNIVEVISKKLKEEGFDEFTLPETRVFLKNGTGIGRMEGDEFHVFDRYKNSKLEEEDRIAIIFPVSGG